MRADQEPRTRPSASRGEIVFDVAHLSYRYGAEDVLDDLTFTVRSGEYLGIIGPNGGGKTTLVRILLGLLEPTSGAVRVFGRPVAENPARYEMGYVPQRVARADVPFPATVGEIVASGRTARMGFFRRGGPADAAAISRAMRVAGVERHARRRVGALSGGERQRVFIARALAGEPRVLILDEPTVGVDVSAREQFFRFLKSLNTLHGITILFVTHDIDVIAREATTVLCLNHGLMCHGSPEDFIKEEIMERLYGRSVRFVQHVPRGDV